MTGVQKYITVEYTKQSGFSLLIAVVREPRKAALVAYFSTGWNMTPMMVADYRHTRMKPRLTSLYLHTPSDNPDHLNCSFLDFSGSLHCRMELVYGPGGLVDFDDTMLSTILVDKGSDALLEYMHRELYLKVVK